MASISSRGLAAAPVPLEALSYERLVECVELAATETGTRRGYAGPAIRVGRGNILVSNTINLTSIAGLLLEGYGKRYSTLVWVGPPDVPMFLVNRTSQVVLRDFRILASSPLLVAVRQQRGVAQVDTTHLSFPSSALTLERVEIDGNDVMQGGFHQYLYDEADDTKNDDSRILNCHITGYTDFGVSYEGEQSINNHIVGCSIVGSTTAPLSTQCGVTNSRRNDHTATFCISQSQVQRNLYSDFDLRAQTRPVSIRDVHSEHSGKFVKMVNGTNAGGDVNASPLVVSGCRFSSTASELNADREVISVDTCGPVVVTGCRFGARNAAIDMKFRVTPPVGAGGFLFEGNVVRTTLATGHFPGMTPNSVAGSLLYRTGTPEAMPT